MEVANKKYMPFGYKLMASYCIFIILPVLLIGYLANEIYIQSMREKLESNMTGTLMQMRDNISYKINDTVRITDMMYFDTALVKHLKHHEQGFISYEATVHYLIPKIKTTIEATSMQIWLSVYLHNEVFPEIYNNYDDRDPLQTGSRMYDVYNISRISDKSWYRDYPKEIYGQTQQWIQIEDDARYGRISMLRRIVDVQAPLRLNELAFIRVSMYLTDLFETVDHQKVAVGTSLYVTNEQQQIMISSGEQAAQPGTQLADLSTLKDHYLIMQEEIPELGWQLTALVPNTAIEESTNTVRAITIGICLIFIIVFFIAGAYMSRFFSKRVRKIIDVLDAFQQGSFVKRVHFKGNDEFTRISQALNKMGHETGELIHKVYIKDIEKKEAELEMLQAQINPHFLYNTLSSINRLAKFGEVDKLQRMVRDLATFYRLSLNEGRTVIPIASELEQAQAYVAIQEIKYKDRVHVIFDIEHEIVKVDTIKLILQPLIENVFEHAWTGEQINIRITGSESDGCIVFKVIDDGIGMHPDLIDKLFDPLEMRSVGFGIRNVDQRIKLYYGEDYGVKISSRPGIGTAVSITFPAQNNK